MTSFKELGPLFELKQEVLKEIVREGEMMVEAQLTVATAADQRALAILGSLVTAFSGVVAGSIALALSETLRMWLVCIGLALGVALAGATFILLRAITPKRWSYPGNLPENWLPSRWNSYDRSKPDFELVTAHVEQAYCLNQAIRKNRDDLDHHARQVRLALTLAVSSVALAGVAAVIGALLQN